MRSMRFSVGLVCYTTIIVATVLVIGLTMGASAPRVGARALTVDSASDVAAPTTGQLSLAADQPLVTDFQTRVQITARVIDPSGSPLVGVPVTFGLDIPDAGKLASLTAMTDESGVATTAFFPTFFRGDVTITGTAGDGTSGQTVVTIDCGC
jgi:hypothetical protein